MEKNTIVKSPRIHTAACTSSNSAAAAEYIYVYIYIEFLKNNGVFKVQLLSKSEKVTVTLEL